MASLIVDAGFLIALYRGKDELHDDALAFLRDTRAGLITVVPVIVETCYFLAAEAKVELLRWIANGGLNVVELVPEAYPALAALVYKYRDLDANLTDVAIVWLAEQLGERRILTVDEREFGAFRLNGKRRFELVKWHR
jgi:predicted nucleic acid-binding protein